MRIRTKISLFAISLVAVVVMSVVANLAILERRRVRAEFAGKVDALMEGVLRIGREALSTEDELMLMSYLKFLMKDYPEIEVAIVSRQDHTSIVGEVRSDVQYRTVAIADPTSEAAHSEGPILATGRDLPPGTLSIQLGFSRTLLERKIRQAQLALLGKLLKIAAFGLLVGILGSLWLGRLLSGSLGELAVAAERIGQGQLDTIVHAKAGDEIGDLAAQFNRMSGKLKELLRFKDDLLSTLSHELKTPLSGVKGFLEYLLESDAKQTSRERRESYQTMAEAVKQMEISLGNALQLFKTEHEAKLNLEDLAVREVVTEVVRLFEPTARVSEIVIQGPVGDAAGRARSDRELVRRLAINLVSNALKYTPPGGVVTLRLQEDRGSVLFSVQDTGPGIAPEYRDQLFSKFYRVPANGHPQRIPGTGLGLAIAKQAADLLGGRIWLESEVGRGSTFYVSIPKRGGDGQ
ncbi:MAG: HAMP domain-containing histidine kinase [Elusimicrobia bacterium]|nr:HAMP domain-containing histidine kinase [Elusimicrobiota bacterium]